MQMDVVALYRIPPPSPPLPLPPLFFSSSVFTIYMIYIYIYCNIYYIMMTSILYTIY